MAGVFGLLYGMIAGAIIAIIGRGIAKARPQPGAPPWYTRLPYETTDQDRSRALALLREGYERGEIDPQSYERFFEQIRRSGLT